METDAAVPPATPATPPAAVTPPVTPAPTPPAAAAPAPGPAAPTTAAEATVDQNWLKERLARERRAGIKAAGFESEEEARAAAEERRAAAEAKKTAETKAAEAAELNRQLKARADSVTALLDEQAKDAFAALTDAQKAAVRLQAADDAPAEDRIKAIRVVRALAATLSSPPSATPAPATTTPAPPATDTAPGRTAPSGGTGSPPNHRAQYEQLSKSNPFEAAKYASEHPEAYKNA